MKRRNTGGIYATHMRSEGDAVLQSIDESTRIGREAHIPVEIWHLKAAGKSNWGKMPQIVARIDAGARSGGGHQREHLCIHGMVQYVFSVCSAVGARRRRREAGGAAEGSGDACADSQGHDEPGKDSAGEEWDNEWQEIPGPEAILIAVVQNPELAAVAGQAAV